MISKPGIFDDVGEAVYHGDRYLTTELGRSLSVSGAKTLLKSPALFAYQRDNRPPPKDVFDFGHVAHKYVLGVGDEIVRVEADDWRTKDARTAREEARAAGQIPILAADDDRAHAMAAAVTAHPVASRLFSDGAAEQSAYWIDEQTGITRRARFDWLRTNSIIDLKSAADASPDGFARAAANFGYGMQAVWYQDATEALLGRRLRFVFVCVEKEPPHQIGLYVISPAWEDLAHAQNRRAITTFAACESSGHWPSYSPRIETLEPPRWLTYAEQDLAS